MASLNDVLGIDQSLMLIELKIGYGARSAVYKIKMPSSAKAKALKYLISNQAINRKLLQREYELFIQMSSL